MNEFDKKCLLLVLSNQSNLPRYVPRGREFMCECDTYLYFILKDIRETDSLTDGYRSNLYFLNTILLSKLGKLVYSQLLTYNLLSVGYWKLTKRSKTMTKLYINAVKLFNSIANECEYNEEVYNLALDMVQLTFDALDEEIKDIARLSCNAELSEIIWPRKQQITYSALVKCTIGYSLMSMETYYDC